MKTVEEKIVAGEMVTGNFTIQAAMGKSGKSITVSGYIYATSTPEAVNAQIDFLHDVVDRQTLRSEIPELEAKMEQRVVQMGQIRDVLSAHEAKVAGGGKLSSAEKQQLTVYTQNLGHIKEDMEKGVTAIAEAKLKAGVK
jgi:propanediol dehydratase small subunit